ncbi:MAG TPA: bifunctional diaminohydroxyphosphoribosylaminopyrimidine deaminase/5-amino-6-(5-phosphoribosylamino)uracil reductase RibD [Actinomycetes bacterium]|nr:bifunctional diaminohydroxyphosphoribosylaminopyrimidine deaminase/5-amino-6-(5-phosphoribosylamino)uracil reductase RibD [Actinomycetes bacterium]
MVEVTRNELAAMRQALELAASAGVPLGPNPRVGAVLLDQSGEVIATGWHRGAGTPHAEIVALEAAGARARGATAVVTLEPCNHTGRTGPCSQALVDAGVSRVVFGQSDTHELAAGGAARLAAAGVVVLGGVLAEEAMALNEVWTFAVTAGRPFVTWKLATTLDGRVAASDGTSRWITSAAARDDAHRLRAEVDAIVVGTGTVLTDDPHLTVRRNTDGGPTPTPPTPSAPSRGPLRVVVGNRTVPSGSRVLDDAAPTLLIPLHDPAEVLAKLYALDVQHVLLEGGPTLAGAFVRAKLVDRVVAYIAPALLGAGASALSNAGITTIDDALRLNVDDIEQVGSDLRVTSSISHPSSTHRLDEVCSPA